MQHFMTRMKGYCRRNVMRFFLSAGVAAGTTAAIITNDVYLAILIGFATNLGDIWND